MSDQRTSKRAERTARTAGGWLDDIGTFTKPVYDDKGATIVPELDQAAIAGLVDRLWYDTTADGWPSSVGYDGMPHGTADQGGSTLQAVLNRIDATVPPDLVADTVNQMLADLRDMAKLANKVRRQRIWIEKHRNTGRQTSLADDCKVCGNTVTGAENDRLRSGLCVRCYHRWTRRGKPEMTPVEEHTDLGSIERGAPIRYWFPGCGFTVELVEDKRGDIHQRMVVDERFELAEKIHLGDSTINAADLIDAQPPKVQVNGDA